MAQRPSPDVATGLSATLAELPEVRLAWWFGSRARGQARPDSDIDVAVVVEPSVLDRMDRSELLRHLAGRLGSSVASHRLDLVLLNGAPPLLRHRVLRDGKLLLARTEEERVRFVRRTLTEVQDSAFRREMHTRARIRRLEQGRDNGRSRDLLAQARRVAELLGQAPRLR